jgi:hypothetical protein
VPAASLAPYAPGVLIGTELRGRLIVVTFRDGRVHALRLPTTLPAVKYNLEGATTVG